jgi:uncharacterized protein
MTSLRQFVPSGTQETRPAGCGCASASAKPFNMMMLILSEACNLRCIHCYEQELGYHADRKMPWDTARRAVNLLFRQIPEDTPHSCITLFGGEPLLEIPLLRRIVEYSFPHRTISGYSGRKANYIINTNGTVLPPDAILLFRQLGPRLNLRISVDGFEESHDRVRKTKAGGGSWQLLQANFEAFRNLANWHGVRIHFVATVNRLNYSSLFHDHTRLFEALSFPIATLFVHDQPWTEEELAQVVDQVAMLRKWCSRRGLLHSLCRFPENSRYSEDHIRNDCICGAGVSSFTVNYRGDVFPCHRVYYFDQLDGLMLGNVHTGLLPEVVLRFQRLNRLSNMKQACQQCPAALRERCHLCLASNQRVNGDWYRVSDRYCKFMKALYEGAVREKSAVA